MQGVRETIGGIVVDDPFRWLEDDGDRAVRDWQTSENAKTMADLAASPHFAAVVDAVRSTFEDVGATWAPIHCGERWFRSILPADSFYLAIQVSASPREAGHILFDPRDHGEGTRLLMHTPSPDGRLVLVQLMAGAVFRHLLIDGGDGRIVRDLGAMPSPTAIAWAADGSGFYLRLFGLEAQPDGSVTPTPEIWWQPVDGERVVQPLALNDVSAFPIVSADGRWAAVLVDQGALRPVWLRQGQGAWVPFLSDDGAMYKGIFVGDEYWAISDDTSGWCRLVAIPLASFADRATWREIIPARKSHKLSGLALCGDHVALSVIEGGLMRLRSLDRNGLDLGAVALPGDGAFGIFGMGHILAALGTLVIPDGDGCTFVFSGLDRSCGVYRADLATRTVEELEAPAHHLAGRDIARFTVAGPQGPVSYLTMRKAETPLDGSAPVIVFGYGGFNVPQIPHYLPMAAAWIELGGVWVHAQLRGGGEGDTEFWQAGRMHRKQGTFDDLFAVIEDLQARGDAVAGRTGVFGTSNGGLLVGAAVTQRPDLIRAAVAQVPLLDLLQCRKDAATMTAVLADYGNPNDAADAPVIHAYSPYHNIRPGTAYPALLCDAGATDLMTPPWHSRKMVAAVRAASGSGRRTMLRVRDGAGHNLMTSDLFIERDIEELTFFRDELADEVG